MADWTDDIDPATIPDQVILSERGRRNAARRVTLSGGRVWRQHRPEYSRCRCTECNAARAGAAQRASE